MAKRRSIRINPWNQPRVPNPCHLVSVMTSNSYSHRYSNELVHPKDFFRRVTLPYQAIGWLELRKKLWLKLTMRNRKQTDQMMDDFFSREEEWKTMNSGDSGVADELLWTSYTRASLQFCNSVLLTSSHKIVELVNDERKSIICCLVSPCC